MNKIVISLMLFVVLGCSSTTQEKESVTTSNQEYSHGDELLSLYFEIVHALQNDDYLGCRTSAQKLAQLKANDGVTLALVRIGALLQQAPSLYAQRAILKQFGIVIPIYIEEQITNDFFIYSFTCTNKTDGNKVVWLDVNKNTTNPYIGGNSSDCIELKQTIKPVIKK